ncbi:MAG TPA: restriction endonuclease subunit S [Flavobacteriales bacterium]|nr:restriction endonuclease subunit S [Flavobacteriales bacterium]
MNIAVSEALRTKPSGNPWLGEVPAHWEVKRADAVLEEQRTMLQSEGFVGREVFHYSIPSIQETGDGAVEEGETIASAKTWITKEVLLVSKLNPRKGTVLIGRPREQLTVCSGEFIPLVAVGCDLRYAEYVYRSEEVRQQMDAAVRSVTRSHQRASSEDIRKVQWAWPPLPEQRAIAAFLDERTARIDALVARKRRLVQLLKVKRQALITRAVTRGLDMKAKMKKSGVPWLGEVPEGWEVAPLVRFVRPKPGAVRTGPFGSQLVASEMSEGEVKVYNQRTVIDRDFELGDNYITREKYTELKSFTIEPGDVLVTTRGTIGRCVVFPDSAEPGILHPCLMRVQVQPDRLSREYLELLIDESGLVTQQLRIMSNATTIEVIYSESLKRVVLLVPPLLEQEVILEHIGHATTRLDALVTKVEQAVERLQEYRTALISAAVTGKVRV